MNATTTTINAEEGGWQDGAPLSIPSAVVVIDMLAYRRLTCPGCRKRGMKAVPQRSASDGYRVLCSCRTCRHTEVC